MAKVIDDGIKTDLNDKQRAFCVEYLESLNGTQSYKKAYGSDLSNDVAKTCASKLLSKANIKKYINELIDSYSSNVDITVAEIVDNIKSIALSDDVSASNKLKALEMLARYRQMFTDKVEITSTDITVGLED